MENKILYLTFFLSLLVIILAIAIHILNKTNLSLFTLIFTLFFVIPIYLYLFYYKNNTKDDYQLIDGKFHDHQHPQFRKHLDKHLKELSTNVMGTKDSPIYIIDNYLSEKECKDLIKVSEGSYKPSPITKHIKNFRTSETSFFTGKDNIQNALEDKILATMKSEPKYGEKSQMQHYNVGNEFKPHFDWFQKGQDKFWYDKGQRTWTFMIYLNNVEEGGITEFTELKQGIVPKMGRAVIWGNMTANNVEDRNVKHAGRPITKGEKYIVTKWFKKTHND